MQRYGSQNSAPSSQGSIPSEEDVDPATFLRNRIQSHESIGDIPGWIVVDLYKKIGNVNKCI